MEVGELLQLLHGITFSHNHVVKVTQITFFESVKQNTTVIGTMISFDGVCLLNMKNCSASNTNAVGRLQVVQLAPSHSVDTTGTSP